MDPTVHLPLAQIAANDPKYGRRLHEFLARLRDATYDVEDIWQFVAFAMPLVRKSKAQLFQDLWALWVSNERRGGYFVEFGAANGVFLSNTYMLEKEMGWRGVVSEPNPMFLDSIKANRDCEISTKCVFSSSGQSLKFLATPKGEFSRLADVNPGDGHEPTRRATFTELMIESISLNDLLVEHRAPQCIDYLSIDTEGSEFQILEQFDFDRWDVRAITVEHNFMPMREALYDLLTSKGYRRWWPELSRFDDWYVKG